MAVHKKYNRSVLGRGLDDIEGGKGLDALIDIGSVRTQGSSTISEIPLDQIEANPNQPRRDFDEEAMQELATSIEQIGIILFPSFQDLSVDISFFSRRTSYQAPSCFHFFLQKLHKAVF